MLICGFNKTTLLDYPEHVAATVFLGGCNFRCPFCQNRDLLLNPADFAAFTEEEVLTHLKKRRAMLSGVCVSGGEPTIYRQKLPDFLARIKELNLLVKLDTNGTNPVLLRQLYKEHLIDYVAMDIKTGPSDYSRVAGLSEVEGSIFTASGQNLLENVKESVHFLMHETNPSVFTYEFRTTVVRELHNTDSFNEIADWIQGATRYYLQSYKDSDNVLCPGFHAYSKLELETFADQIRSKIPSVALRGVD